MTDVVSRRVYAKQAASHLRRLREARRDGRIEVGSSSATYLKKEGHWGQNNRNRQTKIQRENMKILEKLHTIKSKPSARLARRPTRAPSYYNRVRKITQINTENQAMMHRLQHTRTRIDSGIRPKLSARRNSRIGTAGGVGAVSPANTSRGKGAGSGDDRLQTLLSCGLPKLPNETSKRKEGTSGTRSQKKGGISKRKQEGKRVLIFSQTIKIGSYLIQIRVFESKNFARHVMDIIANSERDDGVIYGKIQIPFELLRSRFGSEDGTRKFKIMAFANRRQLVFRVLDYLEICSHSVIGIRMYLKKEFMEEVKRCGPVIVEWTKHETKSLIIGVKKHDTDWKSMIVDPDLDFHPTRTHEALAKRWAILFLLFEERQRKKKRQTAIEIKDEILGQTEDGTSVNENSKSSGLMRGSRFRSNSRGRSNHSRSRSQSQVRETTRIHRNLDLSATMQNEDAILDSQGDIHFLRSESGLRLKDVGTYGITGYSQGSNGSLDDEVNPLSLRQVLETTNGAPKDQEDTKTSSHSNTNHNPSPYPNSDQTIKPNPSSPQTSMNSRPSSPELEGDSLTIPIPAMRSDSENDHSDDTESDTKTKTSIPNLSITNLEDDSLAVSAMTESNDSFEGVNLSTPTHTV